MRFGSAPETSAESVVSPGTAFPPPRRIAIAYPTLPIGRALLQTARERVLQPSDTVDIVHVFPRDDADNPMKEVGPGRRRRMRSGLGPGTAGARVVEGMLEGRVLC